MLQGARLAIFQLHHGFYGFGICRGSVRWRLVIGLWCSAALSPGTFVGLRVCRFTVPLRVAEVVVGFDEIVNGEVVFAVIKAGAAPDDVFELNHRAHRPHQHDVAHVSGFKASGGATKQLSRNRLKLRDSR